MQLHVGGDGLDGDRVQRPRLRQEDGQGLLRQVHGAEGPRAAGLDDELAILHGVAQAVVVHVAGVVLLEGHAVGLRLDEIDTAGQPVDLDLVDVRHDLLAAEAAAAEGLIGPRVVINIALAGA